MEWVFLSMIITLIVVGLFFASTTQDLDEQNERYRKERDND